jgi:hypothetical protein
MKKTTKQFFTVISVILFFVSIPFLFVPFIVWCLVLVAFSIYSRVYFHSSRFKQLKSSIAKYTSDSNELNDHIEDLRSSYVFNKTDYGETQYTNTSKYNYAKKNLKNIKYAPNIYDCSRTVCDNARKQPFKYIEKYFNIKHNPETLAQYEEILNRFIAAENGKDLLLKQKKEIITGISKDIP